MWQVGFTKSATRGLQHKCDISAPRLGACCHHPVSGIFSLAYISSMNGRWEYFLHLDYLNLESTTRNCFQTFVVTFFWNLVLLVVGKCSGWASKRFILGKLYLSNNHRHPILLLPQTISIKCWEIKTAVIGNGQIFIYHAEFPLATEVVARCSWLWSLTSRNNFQAFVPAFLG